MAIYYMATGGNNANSGSSASPWLTLSYSVAQLTAGDTLFIRSGTYTGSSNRVDSAVYTVPSGTSWSNAVTIAGYPGETVIIRHPDGTHAIRLTAGTPHHLIFQDFQLDSVNQTGGLGAPSPIYLSDSAHHNRFQRLELYNGDDVDVQITFGTNNGSADFNEVLDCEIYDNVLAYAAYVESGNNLFDGNYIHDCGTYGLHFYDNVGPRECSNNVARNNRMHDIGTTGSGYAITFGYGDDNLAYNNLIYDCQGGILNYYLAVRTGIYNNTIYNCVDEGILNQTFALGEAVARNNILYSNGVSITDADGDLTESNNLTTDPDFVNAGAGDFTVNVGSDAIDAGTTVSAVTTDFAGLARVAGSYDIGAYEYGGAIPTPFEITVDDIFNENQVSAVYTDLTSSTVAVDSLSIVSGIQGSGPMNLLASAGTCSFTLKQFDAVGQFSPSHASCLTGWGIGTIIRATAVSADLQEFPVFLGKVQVIDPEPGQYGGAKLVHVVAADYMQDITDASLRNVSAQIYQTDATLIQTIIDALPSESVPLMGVEIDEGVTTFPIAFAESAGGISARALLNDVNASSFGIYYQRGDGVHVWKNRLTRTFTESVDTFADDDLIGLAMPSNQAAIFNRVQVSVPQVEMGTSPVVICEALGLDTDPIPAGETREIWMAYRDSNNLQNPVGGFNFTSPLEAGVDYEYNELADGSGSDLTADMVVSAQAFGGDAKFVVTNTHATLSAYRIIRQLRGCMIISMGDEAFESVSAKTYGQRTLRVQTAFPISPVEAQLQADYLRGQYEGYTQRPEAIEILPHKSSRLMRHALEREPSDRITLSETVTGAACDAFIQSKELAFHENGLLSCRWGLAPQTDFNFIAPWKLGVVGRSELGVTTVLG